MRSSIYGDKIVLDKTQSALVIPSGSGKEAPQVHLLHRDVLLEYLNKHLTFTATTLLSKINKQN